MGCDLSNFVMGSVLGKDEIHCKGKIFSKGVQLLAYADEMDIIGHIKRDVTVGYSATELELAGVGQQPSICCRSVGSCGILDTR